MDKEITIFDEHHEAFLYWEEAISSGKLRKNATLLHVDGHSDIGNPLLTASVYSNDIKSFTERQINIGNFIIPAVAKGIFTEVIFLSKGLSRLQKRTKLLIGTFKGGGIWIKSSKKKGKFINKFFPDLKKWHYSVMEDPGKIKKRAAVLDIDLDYFYGNMFPQPQIGLELTNAQIKHLKQISLSNDKYRISLLPFTIEKKILKPELDSRFKNVIYNNSKEWIELAIMDFIDSLHIVPELISICRSVKSGFTPIKYSQFAEETLVRYLKGKQKKVLDPCDVLSPFEVYPFSILHDNLIHNLLTGDILKLKEDMRIIWKKIKQGKNFPTIYNEMRKMYAVNPDFLKREVLKFILNLKKRYIIK